MPLDKCIIPGLQLIMLGMGMTLLPADFVRVAKMPKAVACGVIAQFLIMPLVGLGLAELGQLEPSLALGMIIVGSCPSGVASNVMTYLAKGDVPLAVSMTACSTALAVVLTPLCITLYGKDVKPGYVWTLAETVLWVVLLPVIGGMLLRVRLPKTVNAIIPRLPAISVLVIVLLITAVVAKHHPRLLQVSGQVGLLVVLHNVLGGGVGYVFAMLWGLSETQRRTIAIEVGIQNSALGIALVDSIPTDAPGLAASARLDKTLMKLPSALFSVVQNVTGPLLAAHWARTGQGASGASVASGGRPTP